MASAHLEFKDLLTSRMKARRMSDGALSKELADLGISLGRVSILRYRQGAAILNLEHGKALCQVLGISPSRLLDSADRQHRRGLSDLERTSRLKGAA
jgi:transcriptional regulator with XRE-family HTH domain